MSYALFLAAAALSYGGPQPVMLLASRIALAAALLYLRFSRGFPLQRSARIILAAFAYLLLWATCSISWALDREAATRATFYVALLGAGQLLAVRTASDPRRLRGLFFAVAAAVSVLSIVALRQAGQLAVAPYSNPNDLAATATSALAPVLWQLPLPFVVLPAWLIVRTASRSCILVLGCTVTAFLALKRRWRLLDGGGLALVTVIAWRPELLGEAPRRFLRLLNPQEYTNTLSLGVRARLVLNAWAMAKSTAFRGVGAGNAAAYAPLYRHGSFGAHDNLHSPWLELLACYGPVPLVVMVSVLLFSLVRLLKITRHSTDFFRYLSPYFRQL